MKTYSKRFQQNFLIVDIATLISGYDRTRDKYDMSKIAVKVYNAEPLSDENITTLKSFISHLIVCDRFFRSDKNGVDAALWLLDAMDDDCEEMSDYEADIKDKAKKY